MSHRQRDPALTPPNRGRGNRRPIAGGFVVSVLLHAVVLLLLLLRLTWEPEPEPLPPPATVNMVFEGGHPELPTTSEPIPTPEPSIAPPMPQGGPPGEAATPPPAEPPPPPPTPPPPEPVAPPPEPPRPPEPTPPEPAPPQPAPPEPAPPPPPVPPPPPPPAPNPQPTEPGPAEIPVPPPMPPAPPAAPVPIPPKPVPETPPPKPAKEPPPPPPKQQTWPPTRQAAPAEPQSSFPAPMDFSFGPPKTATGAATPGKPLLSLGLPRRGPDDSTPFSMETDAEVGPDWRNALSEWVEEHSYYPQQAAALGQQGSTQVLVTTMPNGRVVSVELEHGSGSPWLDLALEGLFRGAKLPPMPKSVGDQPVPFHFTMHYIIVR